MQAEPSGYIVQRQPEGFGQAIPLQPGQRYVIGRHDGCEIKLRDDMCSRRHAQLSWQDGKWYLLDLQSLNGSFLNDERIQDRRNLKTGDEIRVGRTRFLFVHKLEDLPSMPDTGTQQDLRDDLAITERSHQSRYLPPRSQTDFTQHSTSGKTTYDRLSTADAGSLLFQLAIELAECRDLEQLTEHTLAALMQATPAGATALLRREASGEVALLGCRLSPTGPKEYRKPASFVLQETERTRQAVLAEGTESDLTTRSSEGSPRVTSLICAPITHQDTVLGHIHLYCTEFHERLNRDDLEFCLAAARQVALAWANLVASTGLVQENQLLKDQLRLESELVGSSPLMLQVLEQIRRTAPTRATVLIRGESGVGKELVARAIHANSPRRERPLVTINCAALTETLLERELFGHEKGAFTGAAERVIGKFEAADGGSIFLDEIGEMSPATQAKLLRVLEGQPFERLGGHTPIKVDVRVIAATNRSLEAAIQEGRFREDLYYRLQVIQMDLPPLRQRREDIPLLADYFLKRFIRETGRKIRGFTDGALNKLCGYDWPGNVRELRNAIERAVTLGSKNEIYEADIWLSPITVEPERPVGHYTPQSLEQIEREHIRRTLEFTNWNKSRAAEILGIERSTLDRKIKAYGLTKT